MLSDVEFIDISSEHYVVLRILNNCIQRKKEISLPGIYYIYSYNPRIYIKTKFNDYFMLTRNGVIIPETLKDLKHCITNDISVHNAYGVCDNHEQVLEYYNLVNATEKFAVFLTPVHKEHQHKEDGWRWEKWGEYIGNQESQADYLYDEPKIELIHTYHIFNILE